ncbi:MAG: hypothetical protein WCK67_02850 [bacterium]
MEINPKRVRYVKPSLQGTGIIPVGAEGNVLLFIKHPVTSKLLVDFPSFEKAIVPLSSVEILEEHNG